jgi:long-chain acyl-CoA synthetase
LPIRTLAELFTVAAGHQQPALLLHKVDGAWRAISTGEFVAGVERLATALQRWGLAPGERVALMADNGPHWPTIDFATLTSGAALVPIYPTLLPEQAAYVARDSGARVVFVETREQLDGLLGRRGELPEVQLFVLIRGEAQGDGVLTLAELDARGREVDAAALGERLRAVGPGDLASLIYTSGTTGRPKGVMLSHGNLASNVLASVDRLGFSGEYTALSFLPLSHSFERTVDYCYFFLGVTIAYAESVQAVAQNFLEVRPHTFVAVPRVYEKVLAKVYENADRSSAVKRRIFRWAVGVGRRALPYRLAQRRPPGLLGLRLALADRLVFAKIRGRLGGRFEHAISGGAPLGREVAEFFWGAGIRIYEGYGLTETSPVVSVNCPGAVKLGTVGQPIPGVEVRIAADGEILVRGPNVMQGYYGQAEASAEVLDGDGWFRSGDVGHLDSDGYLLITDRKKEIIVNAYGKNVAPAPIENQLKASRFIGQAVVIGDRRKFLSALLVPDFEALAGWAKERGIDAGDREALLADERVRTLFSREVAAVNAANAHFEAIGAWELLPAEFTLEGGELTPTQKVKRRVVHDKYGDLIAGMYRQAEQRPAARPDAGAEEGS